MKTWIPILLSACVLTACGGGGESSQPDSTNLNIAGKWKLENGQITLARCDDPIDQAELDDLRGEMAIINNTCTATQNGTAVTLACTNGTFKGTLRGNALSLGKTETINEDGVNVTAKNTITGQVNEQSNAISNGSDSVSMTGSDEGRRVNCTIKTSWTGRKIS